MGLANRASYIKGLSEGLGLKNEGEREEKILFYVVELLQDLTQKLEEVDRSCNENRELICEVDDDLAYLENILENKRHSKVKGLHGECASGGACSCHNAEDDGEKYENEFNEEKAYEVVCPNCKKSTKLDDRNFADGKVVCSDCGEKLEFDFSGFLDGE